MITVLSGGTGTPKLLQGLKEIVDPSDLTIIVNTLENDYFSGVYVSADIDTVLYTMSDMINDEMWYGVKDDTFIAQDWGYRPRNKDTENPADGNAWPSKGM